MKTVFLLTTGDGEDGSEWHVHGIFSNKELAEIAKKQYENPQFRPDGSEYSHRANDIEEWEVDKSIF